MRICILISIILVSFAICYAAYADNAYPVAGGRLTSVPGWRPDPFGSGKKVYHRGFDIAVPTGTPVRPTQEGLVYYAGPHKGYGWLVAVDHGTGYVTMYGHLSKILVPAGTRVSTNTVIALSGNTGRSTGPHLHYEIRRWPDGRGYQSPPEMPNGTPSNHDEDDDWINESLGVTAKATPILRDNEWVKGM